MFCGYCGNEVDEVGDLGGHRRSYRMSNRFLFEIHIVPKNSGLCRGCASGLFTSINKSKALWYETVFALSGNNESKSSEGLCLLARLWLALTRRRSSLRRGLNGKQ